MTRASSIHELAIQRVINKWSPQAVYTKDFHTRLREIQNQFEMMMESERLLRRPDAWSYIPHRTTEFPGTFYLFEIENENPMTEAKLCDYANFYSAMDFYDCDIRLFVYDRYGESEREINLKEYYFLFAIAAADAPEAA